MCQITHVIGRLSVLIKKTNSLDIHSKNLQLMMIKVFKSLNHIGPQIIWDTFEIRDIPYELRQGQTIRTLHAHELQTLNSSFDFPASLAWNKFPGNIKSLKAL